jgi:hypothetical protein
MTPHFALGPGIECASVEIGEVQTPKRDMKQEGLQGSVLLGCEHSSTQRCRYQLSTVRPEELRELAGVRLRGDVWAQKSAYHAAIVAPIDFGWQAGRRILALSRMPNI